MEVFKNVLEHYRGSQLPEMKYLCNTLQSKFGLPAELHEELSSLFRENCIYLKMSGPLATTETAEGVPVDKSAQAVVIGEPKQGTGRVCFVKMPFNEITGRFPRGFFVEVLNSLIIPAATDAGFEVKTANRQGTKIIHGTIIIDNCNNG